MISRAAFNSRTLVANSRSPSLTVDDLKVVINKLDDEQRKTLKEFAFLIVFKNRVFTPRGIFDQYGGFFRKNMYEVTSSIKFELEKFFMEVKDKAYNSADYANSFLKLFEINNIIIGNLIVGDFQLKNSVKDIGLDLDEQKIAKYVEDVCSFIFKMGMVGSYRLEWIKVGKEFAKTLELLNKYFGLKLSNLYLEGSENNKKVTLDFSDADVTNCIFINFELQSQKNPKLANVHFVNCDFPTNWNGLIEFKRSLHLSLIEFAVKQLNKEQKNRLKYLLYAIIERRTIFFAAGVLFHTRYFEMSRDETKRMVQREMEEIFDSLCGPHQKFLPSKQYAEALINMELQWLVGIHSIVKESGVFYNRVDGHLVKVSNREELEISNFSQAIVSYLRQTFHFKKFVIKIELASGLELFTKYLGLTLLGFHIVGSTDVENRKVTLDFSHVKHIKDCLFENIQFLALHKGIVTINTQFINCEVPEGYNVSEGGILSTHCEVPEDYNVSEDSEEGVLMNGEDIQLKTLTAAS